MRYVVLGDFQAILNQTIYSVFRGRLFAFYYPCLADIYINSFFLEMLFVSFTEPKYIIFHSLLNTWTEPATTKYLDSPHFIVWLNEKKLKIVSHKDIAYVLRKKKWVV